MRDLSLYGGRLLTDAYWYASHFFVNATKDSVTVAFWPHRAETGRAGDVRPWNSVPAAEVSEPIYCLAGDWPNLPAGGAAASWS